MAAIQQSPEDGMSAEEYIGYLVPLVGDPSEVSKGNDIREEFMLDMASRIMLKGRKPEYILKDMRRLAHFCNCCQSAREWSKAGFRSLLARFEKDGHPFWNEFLGGWDEKSDEEFFMPCDVEGLDQARWRNNRASRKDLAMARF